MVKIVNIGQKLKDGLDVMVKMVKLVKINR